MIQQQDQTIHSIAGTLSTIAQQAGLMGTEISEHNECAASLLILTRSLIRCRMLDDLDHGVDQTGSKLSDAMRRMRKFVRETEGQFPRPRSGIWDTKHFDRTKIGMVYRHSNCGPTHLATCSHIGVIVGYLQMFAGPLSIIPSTFFLRLYIHLR